MWSREQTRDCHVKAMAGGWQHQLSRCWTHCPEQKTKDDNDLGRQHSVAKAAVRASVVARMVFKMIIMMTMMSVCLPIDVVAWHRSQLARLAT